MPDRSAALARLKSDDFDVFVIGGGATGLGTALEAARRGYKVAVVDRGDWAEGTSSKSSNMHHGGVRYLQAFVSNPEGAEENLRVVKNGIAEQQYLYHSAPYLVHPVPIMVPCYTAREVEQYGQLLKKYDELGEEDPYPSSHWCSKSEALFRFPQLISAGLEGAWVYYDGCQDDARMALLIALTAEEAGACAINYVEVKDLTKDARGKVTGVTCADNDAGADGTPFQVRARVVVNCCGPFCDAVRKMDDPAAGDIITPSAGTHIVLPAHFSPAGTGMAILETSDGRAMFYLPWQGRTLVGTTDYLTPLDKWPVPPQKDIDFILGEVNRFLCPKTGKATREDVLSAWVGIRPLAAGTQTVTGTSVTEAGGDAAEDAGGTAKATREHTVAATTSGLVNVAGGKWTSYRHMAEDAVDAAVRAGGLAARPAVTGLVGLVGTRCGANKPAEKIQYASGASFHATLVELKREYHVCPEAAAMLCQSYGLRAFDVCDLAQHDKALRKPISGQYPWILAQVAYACREEHARHAADVLQRRTRLCQVDVLAAHLATPKVIGVMAKELGWDEKRKEEEAARTEEFLKSCGLEMRLKATAADKKNKRASLFAFQHGA